MSKINISDTIDKSKRPSDIDHECPSDTRPDIDQTKCASETLPLDQPIPPTEQDKITVRLSPIGSTPAIKPRVFKIAADSTVSGLSRFVCKRLRHNGQLHLYVQNSFSPTPDEVLGDLFKLFRTGGELVVGYCFGVAFG